MSEERKGVKKRSQNIMLENRKRMSITGVLDVPKFTGNMVRIKTDLGKLTLKGGNFRLIKLNLEDSIVEIEGNFNGLDYSGMNFTRKVFGHGS